MNSRRYWFPKHYADVVQRLRVPCGFAMVAAFAWLSAPTKISLIAGLPVAGLGLAVRAWAAGHLAKNERLATSGPYAHLRNPLYLGTLTVALGLVIAARQPLLALLFGAIFLLVYLPAIELEEQHLRTLFPEYAAYAERVPMLQPHWRGMHSGARFRFALYRKNQEYKAALGLAAGAAFLFWKAGLLGIG
jgi:protein-S-isoprenylcysteine O-methyltransferase Ste14